MEAMECGRRPGVTRLPSSLSGRMDVPAHVIHTQFEEMWDKLINQGGRQRGREKFPCREQSQQRREVEDAPRKPAVVVAPIVPQKRLAPRKPTSPASKRKRSNKMPSSPPKAQRVAPSDRRCKWQPEEREVFMTVYRQHGRDWEELARRIPGKTEKQIKNYYMNCKKKLGLEAIDLPEAARTGRRKRAAPSPKKGPLAKEAGSDAQCLICFEALGGPKQGRRILRPCGHKFHGKCIKQWLKKQNTCPLCRVRITHFEGRKLEDKDQHGLATYYDTLVCEACNSGEREEEIVLCDACDAGYHMGCLEPPLTELPHDLWFCPSCSRE
mmetsp:Transcript_34396/g.74495  ORF Transcript_34396/g.74495 Transcript_34396/m.74495 type:complete len:325 (-) Transcript_34396:1079-2053(-)